MFLYLYIVLSVYSAYYDSNQRVFNFGEFGGVVLSSLPHTTSQLWYGVLVFTARLLFLSAGFGHWQMGNQSQDEVFLAAQEAVGAHRDSQGKIFV